MPRKTHHETVMENIRQDLDDVREDYSREPLRVALALAETLSEQLEELKNDDPGDEDDVRTLRAIEEALADTEAVVVKLNRVIKGR